MPDVLNLYSAIDAAIEEHGPAKDMHPKDKVQLVMLVVNDVFAGDETCELIQEAMHAYIEQHYDGSSGEL